MATTRLFTVEDVEQSPPEGEWELIDGEIVPVTPANFGSSSLGLRIGRIIGNFVEAHDLGEMTGADGGYVLFPERATIRVPDAAFIRKDRLPPENERSRFLRLAPDFLVEVLSPSNRAGEVAAKLEMYKEAGVPVIWVVDPERKTVTVIASGQPDRVLSLGDSIDGDDVIPGFSATIAELFG